MSDTFTFKLAGTSKKDFYGNSRQDNLLGLEVGDGISLEQGQEADNFDDVVLVMSDLGEEIGEVPTSYVQEIGNLLSRDYESTGFVKSLEELPSGKRSVQVEITFLPPQPSLQLKPFYSKIRGCEASNDDGSSRQSIIKSELHPGDLLGYLREPSNHYDGNAIAILSPTGKQIGYFSTKLAAEFAPFLDAGGHLEINVEEITGGDNPGKSLGVNIHVIPQATKPVPRMQQELPATKPVPRMQQELPAASPSSTKTELRPKITWTKYTWILLFIGLLMFVLGLSVDSATIGLLGLFLFIWMLIVSIRRLSLRMRMNKKNQ